MRQEIIDLQVLKKDAEQARVELILLRNGLKNTTQNFAAIKYRLGPFYTVEQFREAIKDSAFKNSLQWIAPAFQEAVQQEQQRDLAEQKRRREFSAVVRALTTANIMDCTANYEACNHQLEDLLAAHALTESTYIQNLTEGIVAGYFEGLVKNDSDTTQDLDRQNREQLLNRLVQDGRLHPSAQYAPQVRRKILNESTFTEMRERANLVSEIADDYCNDRYLNSIQFCSLYASVKSNQEYRADLEQVRERKRLARMSPSEIRAENERVRTVQNTIDHHEADMVDGYKKLRPESKWNGELIDKGLLWRVSKEDVARLLKIYGKNQLDFRIRNGVPTAVAQEQQ